jgi:hypothetical protein
MLVIYFLLFKFFQMLCLDDNILLLKLTSLVDMRRSVAARASVNRNVDRVLIFENHFCTIGEELQKTSIRSKVRTFYLFLGGCFSYNKYNFYLLCTLHDVTCTAGNNK